LRLVGAYVLFGFIIADFYLLVKGEGQNFG
jgi:hypothetical protein